MRVLAIDPGYERVGIAVIIRESNTDSLIYSACFKTSSSLSFDERLLLIGEEVSRIIREFCPDFLAIETLLFSKNQKTAIGVAEARGVILYEGAKNSLKIREFTPLQVKIAVTGYGRGDKKQMIAMIPKIIRVEKEIKHDDEYDAIGIAITCLASERTYSRV